MEKKGFLIGGLGLGVLFLASNSLKATTGNTSNDSLPKPSDAEIKAQKEKLLVNYKSAILNVINEYNKLDKYYLNDKVVDKYCDKIILARITDLPNPTPFWKYLFFDKEDIKIPDSKLTAHQIIKDLEKKVYLLY